MLYIFKDHMHTLLVLCIFLLAIVGGVLVEVFENSFTDF